MLQIYLGHLLPQLSFKISSKTHMRNEVRSNVSTGGFFIRREYSSKQGLLQIKKVPSLNFILLLITSYTNGIFVFVSIKITFTGGEKHYGPRLIRGLRNM